MDNSQYCEGWCSCHLLWQKEACFSEILVHIYCRTCRQSSYSSTSASGQILNKCNIMCIRCSHIWNILRITYSRNVGLLNKVYEYWPLQGFRVAIIHGSEEHVPLFTPSLDRYTAPHFVLGLILQVTISYASIVHKPTACKYPKFLFVLSGDINNANSFQSRQEKCRCDFFALCCLQNGSHPVHCSLFACLSEACRWIFSFQNVIGSLWTRCTHILSLLSEASDSNLSRIAGCPVMSLVVLQANILLLSD